MKYIDLKQNIVRYTHHIKVILSDLLLKYFFSNKKLEKKIKSGKIGRLYFEVTNICNAKCSFCAYRKISQRKDFNRGTMSFEIFKKAIDEYQKMGGKKISLTPTIGESLIDSGLFKKIEYALNEAKMFVYFYTNGILLSKDKNYKKIIDLGVNQLDISTEGFYKDSYERVYGVPSYQSMLSGVNKILQYNKTKGEPTEIIISFRSSLRPSNVLKSHDFIKYVKPFLSKKIKYNFLVSYDNWGGRIGKEDLVGVMNLKKEFKIQRMPCKRTYDISILHDGSVRLCACRVKETEFDDLVVGNIKNDSLKNIFNSKRTENVRRSFLNNNIPKVCGNCSLYDPGLFNYYNSVK